MLRATLKLAPGISAGLALAALAWLAGRHLQVPGIGMPVPTLAAALVLGMAAARPLSASRFVPGIDVLAKPLLRLGVALMGFRITLADLQALGWQPALAAIVAATGALCLGYAAARMIGLARGTAFLTATAVAICGASAALAVATVLARRPDNQTGRDVAATVACITIIGTVAVIAYPALCHALGVPPLQAAAFLGASIHEVAQVVAAADVYDPSVGAAAATVKMVRVAMMPAVIFGLIMVLSWRDRRDDPDARSEASVPVFLLGFVAAIVVANAGWITPKGLAALTQASALCLIVSMVALGAQSSIRGVMAMGPRALAALMLQTLLIAALAAGALWTFDHLG